MISNIYKVIRITISLDITLVSNKVKDSMLEYIAENEKFGRKYDVERNMKTITIVLAD